MKFTSTRSAQDFTSAAAITRGIAADGGLFVPCEFPQISYEELLKLADMDYIGRAKAVLKLYLTDYTEEEFQRDWDEIIEVCDDLEADEASEATIDNVEVQKAPEESVPPSGSVTEEILKAKELLDNGIISEEEFCQIKAALIAQM